MSMVVLGVNLDKGPVIRIGEDVYIRVERKPGHGASNVRVRIVLPRSVGVARVDDLPPLPPREERSHDAHC